MQLITQDLLSSLTHQAEPADQVNLLARTTIRKLPTVYHNLLHQRYIQGASIAQIARQCACTEKCVIQWLERAQEAFTRLLEADSAVTSMRRHSTKRTTRSLNSTAAENFQLLPLTKSNDGKADSSL